MNLVCVGFDDDDKVIILGEGKVGNHIRNQPTLLNHLLGHKRSNTIDPVSDSCTSLKELKKMAQAHMNKLYVSATGKQVPFPYKGIQEGRMTVAGFPDSILPIRPTMEKKNFVNCWK